MFRRQLRTLIVLGFLLLPASSPVRAESVALDREGSSALPSLLRAVPATIAFQGFLTDDQGSPIDDAVSLDFALYNLFSGGTDIWMETQPGVAVTQGVFQVALGSVVPLAISLFDGSPLFLGIRIDGEAELPRTQLLSAPFAIRAAEADHALTADVALSTDDGDWTISGSNIHRASGFVGVGTTAPEARLDVDGGGLGGPWMILEGGGSILENTALRLYDKGTADGNRNVIDFAHATLFGPSPIARIRSENEGAHAALGGSLTLETAINGVGTFNANQLVLDRIGRVGIGTASPTQKLDVEGTMETQHLQVDGGPGSWGTAIVKSATGAVTFEVRGQFSGSDTGSWMAMRDGNTTSIAFAGRNGSTGAGGLIHVKNGVGITTVQIVGDTGSGSGRIITPVIEITGGADLVESFPTGGAALAPGTVVAIDESSPGALRASSRPYDRKVAGVISGAGGIDPGIRMGVGVAPDDESPLAMIGRVYAKCTTENGSIRPGDPLTTSSLRGHAMKAIDRDRQSGAVIGKAMSTLAEGTGLVLVLINLQ